MVKVYGFSDDVVEIEDSEYKYEEIGCYASEVRMWFTDGTVVLVRYVEGVWRIDVEHKGSAKIYFTSWEDRAVLNIEAEVKNHEVIDR